MSVNLPFDGQEQPSDPMRLFPSEHLTLEQAEQLAWDVVARIQTYNPAQLLCGLTFPNYLFQSADRYTAWIEYLHHLILTHPAATEPDDVSEDVVQGFFSDLKEIFGAVSMAQVFDEIAGEDRNALQDALEMDNLFIRGKAYQVHQMALLERLLGSIDDWLQLHLEVKAEDFLDTATFLFDALNEQANTVTAALKNPQTPREKGSFGVVMAHDLFRLPPASDAVAKVLGLLSAQAGSKATPNFLLPGKVWPTSRDFPVLSFQNHSYCFNPQSVVEELPRLVAKWIQDRDKTFFDRHYIRRRENVLTEMTLDHLSAVFPGAEFGSNLYYKTGIQDRAETDGVLLVDDIAFIIEAKGGALSFPARRGSASRIKRDFGALVEKAFSQALRTADFIRNNPNGIFTDERGNPKIRLGNRPIRKIYLINPVLDSMDAFSIDLAEARKTGLLSGDAEWIWCVNINDLQLVTDVLDTPTVFLLYLERRLRFNDHSDWFHVHDELDLLDYFLRQGLYLEEKHFEEDVLVHWQADTRELDAYYGAKGVGLALPPKPTAPIYPELRTFLKQIESSGVAGRMAFGLEILSHGGASRQTIMDLFGLLPERLRQRNRPQSGNFERGKSGVSIWLAESLTPEVEEGVKFEHACAKYERKADKWMTSVFEMKTDKPTLAKVFQTTESWQEDPEMERIVKSISDKKYAMQANRKRPGRNEPCPCGSGIKFKKCHGR